MSSQIQLKKCIYLVGAHSTGKTTLANALREKCVENTPMLQEVARSVLKEKGYTAADISNPEMCYQMQKDILCKQYKLENELFDLEQCFISDRSMVDPLVYAKFYIQYGYNDSLCKSDEWKNIKPRYQNRKQSLIVLLEPNEDFLKADGTRKMPTSMDEWGNFSDSFSEFLYENDIPFYVIPGELSRIDERVQQVIEWMNTQH